MAREHYYILVREVLGVLVRAPTPDTIGDLRETANTKKFRLIYYH